MSKNIIHKVFLADDDEDDQLIFKEAIAAIDPSIKCDTASDGVEAYEKLNNMEVLPDLIFLDINMPLVDGFDCLAKLKQEKKISEIPIIMYTTAANSSTILAAQALGANAYFTKPIEHKHLEQKLRKILSTDFSKLSSVITIFSNYHNSI